MALLCIKVAPASGMFPLSPAAAAAAVLQDSELQDLLDFASKSDQQHPHHPSPRLNSKDWNHTTVKNVSNETVRKDLLFKGMNQALQQQKMSPFHTEPTNYSTINPSVG